MTIKIAGLVLAAGLSRRFQASRTAADGLPDSKLTALWQGKPLVRWAAEAALVAGLSPVVVVTGHADHLVSACLEDLNLQLHHNENYAQGLSTSLQAGLAILPPDVDAVVVLLGDMPLVSGDLIRRLTDAFIASPQLDAVVPMQNGLRGNPVVLARKLFPALMALTGDRGAAQVVKDPALHVQDIVLNDPAIAVDVDTAEAWRQLPAL